MPTLSVLHRQPIIRDEKDEILRFLNAIPSWLATRTSTPGGLSKEHFWSPQASVRVLPDEWTPVSVQQFYSQWSFFRLSSLELDQEEYDQVIARIQSRSSSTPSPLERRQ